MNLPASLRSVVVFAACSLVAISAIAADNFSRSEIDAWCIVPFDSKKRGPEERAQMLERIGIRKLAYDYRTEHIPTFDAEIEALQRHKIELVAWWFPGALNDEAKKILEVIERHGVKPQLWITGGGAPTANAAEQKARVEAELKRIRPIAEAAAKVGCQVGLYNHGGWFGEPENQLEIIAALGLPNVGIVYNFHHGHEHIARFPELFRKMQSHLIALNVNGMENGADKVGRKILTVGQGDQEAAMIRVVRESGWKGLVGVLCHRNVDAEAALLDNAEGLEWALKELEKPGSGGPRPTPRAPVPAAPAQAAAAPAKIDYWAVEDAAARAKLPEFQTIPAAKLEELTPALDAPRADSFRTWTRSLGDAGSRRFSSLDQINRGNVKQLEVAWTYHSKDGVGNIQCNPVVIDGTMIAPTVGRAIVGVDAATGVERWRFQPEIAGKRLEDFPARRGFVFWPGDGTHAARVFFTCGNWVYALDPKTGKSVAEFGENGRAAVPAGGTVAGAIFKNVLVLPGYNRDVFGYEVASGKLLWTFHTVPQPGEFGFDSWDKPEQGANCWGGMALDDQRGIAFVTTGSPKPNFIGVPHRGDNLFSNCVIAIDALTGKRLWHFQEIRHDIWDLDIPAPPGLVTIMRDGRRVDCVAAPTKIGNTLLLDRVSGKPIYPFRLRRAPASRLPGEQTAPYQPDLELPQPFARQVFTMDDVTNLSPESHAAMANKVKFANMGWFEPFEESKPTVFYGLHGGAEWTGAAIDAATGWLYVTANELPWYITVTNAGGLRPKNLGTPGEKIFKQTCMACHGEQKEGVGVAPPLLALERRLKDADVLALLKTGRNLMPPAPPMTEQQQKDLLDFLFDRDLPADVIAKRNQRGERPAYAFAGYTKLLDPLGYPGCKPPWGTLNAIDLNTGKLVWKVPLGEYPELTQQGIPKTGTENFGGAIVTAGGLVFAAGTRDECIRAFDSKTGEELWKAKLPFGGVTIPATYEVNGRQFVVIPASGGGKLGLPMGDAYVAFALPQK